MSNQSTTKREPRQPGSAIGKLIIHTDDDEHLADFAEYLPPVLTDYTEQRAEFLPPLMATQVADRIPQQRERE